MTNDQAFNAVFGRSRGGAPAWLPKSPELSRDNPFEPPCRELIGPARGYVAMLNANSGVFGDAVEPHRIPTELMVGEEAVDEDGTPGDFCAAAYGLLMEPYRLAAMVGGTRREPVGRTFAVYPVDWTVSTGLIGLLVEYAPSGQWSLLVPDAA